MSAISLKAAKFIQSHEGFTANAMWDVNAWRIGHGSDTITLNDGTFRTVKKGDVTTAENAAKDLSRRIDGEFIPRIKGQVTAASWDKLSDGAKTALLSFAYNYGSITKQAMRDAAKENDEPKLARVWLTSTKDDNKRLLHVGDSLKNEMKTGDALKKGERMRAALYKRRQTEAALIAAPSDDTSDTPSADRSTGSGSMGIYGILILFIALWYFFG